MTTLFSVFNLVYVLLSSLYLRNFSISSEFSTYGKKSFVIFTYLFNVCRLYSDSSFLILAAVTAAAKSLQSCPTLHDPIDGSPPGSPCP